MRPNEKPRKFSDNFSSAWGGLIDIIGDIAALFGLELRLASRNIIWLSIFLFLAVLSVASIWLSLCVMLYIWLLSLGFVVFTSLLGIVIVNLALLIVFVILALTRLKNIDFPETRYQIQHLVASEDE